ncbi:MAG TPA: SGNH/GDSL hydrolase family protein [Candidatus Brocadiia bacterium]|nr:SGNH/GDSL hydrolase family protein [Candidatus Brocadiia bacterium]
MLHFGKADLFALIAFAAYLMAFVCAVRNPALLKKFVLAAYAVLAAVGMCEIALRTLATAPSGLPMKPGKVVSTAADTMPGISGRIEFSVNSLGLRGPETDLSRTRINVLCVGGSTTECRYVTDEMTWPWLLQTRLADRAARRVFVGNSGKSGHFTAHHLYLLENYAPAGRFDWVIVLCGMNDMGAFLAGDHAERLRWVPDETLSGRRRYAAYYHKTALGRALRECAMNLFYPVEAIEEDPEGRMYAGLRLCRQRALRETPHRPIPPGLDAALDAYRSNLKSIGQLCRERKQNILFMTQPAIYRSDLPAELQRLLWQGCTGKAYDVATLARTLDAYNRAMKETCAAEGFDCLDLDALMPKDATAFYDDCHLNIAGCEKTAAAIHEHIENRLADGCRLRAGR